MKKKTPAPPPPADPPPAPEKGKVSAAILEELKTIKGQNAQILSALKPAKGARGRRNMYGEDLDEEE